MGRVDERLELPVDQLLVGLVGSGLAGVVGWVAVHALALYEPIAEIPVAFTLTCLLAAISLFVTNVVITRLTPRAGTPGDRQPGSTRLERVGVGAILLFVLASVVTFLSALLYFAYPNQWPISPSQAGSVQFWFLVGIALTPIAVGILSAVQSLVRSSS